MGLPVLQHLLTDMHVACKCNNREQEQHQPDSDDTGSEASGRLWTSVRQTSHQHLPPLITAQ